jgi:hypothetical protein
MDFHASLEMVCLKSGLRFRRPLGVSGFEFISRRHGSRRGDGHNDGAGQADLAFADEEHGFVLARFGFAGHQQEAVARLRKVSAKDFIRVPARV